MNEKNQSNFVWVAALVLTSIAAAILSYKVASKGMTNMAYLAGQFVVYALIIAVVFRSLLLRKRDGKLFIVVFFAIYAAMLVAGSMSVEKQKKQAALAFASAQEEMKRISDALQKPGADANSLPAIEAHTGDAPKASGEFGEMERFMKDFMNSAVTFRNQYQQELEAAGWNRLLDANRLKNDLSMIESQSILDRGKSIVSKYELKTNSLFDEGKSRIQSLNISEASKRDMLTGFESGLGKAMKESAEQWQMEKQIVEEVGNMINLLSDHKKWTVENNQFMFYTDGDMRKFNAYHQKIQDISKKQEETQKRRLEQGSKNFENLKNSFQK
ncbi:hypothetical protein [Undibacterium sp. TJN19]|uniref:hypothetical protein n=1 Tax=Undibacterium sp. TJN19 TaxID=3413055 RepID=UPI003BEFA2C7